MRGTSGFEMSIAGMDEKWVRFSDDGAWIRDKTCKKRGGNVAQHQEARYRELKALVEGSRALWSEPHLSRDHGELLYDELGLPK
jgi:hypothetical protein